MSDIKKVAGCDCGKDSLHVCVLEEVPKNLKAYVRSYKPTILKANQADVEAFLALDVDLYVLEPTGSYSYLWIEILVKNGKKYKLVSPRRIRHFCEYRGITNKADTPDAAAIAAYSLENISDEQAFLGLTRLKIRELFLQLNSTTRSKNPVQNRLGQRIGFEFPEYIQTYETAARPWLEPDPPFPFRFIAGEELTDRYSRKRKDLLSNSIGTGISEHTRALARQLCEFERMEYALEMQIEAEINKPEFERYHVIFDLFEIPPRIRTALLSRIYPFEDFLRDGRPFKEYVRGEYSKRPSGKTKRDRSEGEFKLCLGMGKERRQSGNTETWKAGGAKYARTAIWQYVKLFVVIRGATKSSSKAALGKQIQDLITEYEATDSPWLNDKLVEAVAQLTGATPALTSLRLHFQFQTDKKGDRRISATAGRFCRTLYKELVKEFAKPTK